MSEVIPLMPDVTAQADAAVNRNADFLREEVRLAYANLPVSQAVALANGIVLVIVLSFAMDVAPLAGWLAALVVVTLARLLLGSMFRRAAPAAEEWFTWRAS